MLFEFEYGWRDGCREGGRIGDLQYNHDLYAEYQVPSMYCTVAMNITFPIYPQILLDYKTSLVLYSGFNTQSYRLPSFPALGLVSVSIIISRKSEGRKGYAVECSGVQWSAVQWRTGGKGWSFGTPNLACHVNSYQTIVLCCAVLCCAVSCI